MPLVNLANKLDSDLEMGKKRKKIDLKKIGIVILLLVIFVFIPAVLTFMSAKNLSQSAKKISFGIKEENLDIVSDGVKEAKTASSRLKLSLIPFVWLRVIPFIGGYYSDAYGFSEASVYELEALDKLTTNLLPKKQEIGFSGTPTPGQDKVAQVVKILNAALPYLDSIEPDLNNARRSVENINTNKYPEKFGKQDLRRRLEEAKNFIIGVHLAISENKDLIQNLPAALGGTSPKTYLLLFQNDKELRATGGFLTAFAFLKIENGHLSTSKSDDIYRLDEKLLNVCLTKICPLSPPEPIVKYLPEVSGKPRTAWSMRDSNLSPDLPTSLQQFEKMYQLLGEGLPFDGIITIDTQVVEELTRITGPVDIFGTTYSAETDQRCNCPGVIYELEHYAEVASKGEKDRKAVLGTLMSQILAKVLGTGTSNLPDLINTAVSLTGEKHIMYFLHDDKLQTGLSKLNWTGEIKKTSGDYLHINDSNFAGGKSNLYVLETVTQDINIAKDGTVKTKLSIEYKNPRPFNSWLNGILRDYVRVYIPKGSTLTNSKGSDDPVNSKDDSELDKTFFESFLTVRPQNSRNLSFEYTLPNKFTGKNYPLLIQKQPGAKEHHYIIKINGSTKAEFDLTADKELNLSF